MDGGTCITRTTTSGHYKDLIRAIKDRKLGKATIVHILKEHGKIVFFTLETRKILHSLFLFKSYINHFKGNCLLEDNNLYYYQNENTYIFIIIQRLKIV